jgi:hypothetical protein
VGQRSARLRILTLVFTGALIHGGGLTDVCADEVRVLRIELLVFKQLGERQIDMLKREVETILAAQGVTIDWTGGDSRPRVRVMIDRPASALPAATHDQHWPLAATRVVEGRITPPIYVSLDVAARIVRGANPPYSAPALAGIMVPRVVGRAIAHELAHLLLDTRAHTARGLLRARFTADDLVSPIRDAFNLDSGQVALARRHQVLLVSIR